MKLVSYIVTYGVVESVTGGVVTVSMVDSVNGGVVADGVVELNMAIK